MQSGDLKSHSFVFCDVYGFGPLHDLCSNFSLVCRFMYLFPMLNICSVKFSFMCGCLRTFI